MLPMKFWLLVLAVGAEEPYCNFPTNCTDHSMSLRFPAAGSSSELFSTSLGEEIEIHTTVDILRDEVQGVRMGVAHDPRILEILSVTWEGADPVFALPEWEGGPGFNLAMIAEQSAGFIRVAYSGNNQGGWKRLPVRNDILVAISRYRVVGISPTGESPIRFSDDLNPPRSPKMATRISIGGRARTPNTVRNAVLHQRAVKFFRGDADGSLNVRLNDCVVMLQALFLSTPAPFDCLDMLDTNDDGRLGVTDPIVLLTYLFLGGAPLSVPFGECGLDPTTDGIDCRQSGCQ